MIVSIKSMMAWLEKRSAISCLVLVISSLARLGAVASGSTTNLRCRGSPHLQCTHKVGIGSGGCSRSVTK